MIRLTHLLAVAMLGTGVALLAPHQAAAIDYTDYKVKDLLEPCFEGDADSRWGETFEINCEQYIRGYTDAYFHMSSTAQLPRICFPAGANRLDLIRWAFIKWARQNTDKQHLPAAEGLITAVNREFECP